MKLQAVLSSHYSTVQKHNSKERSKKKKFNKAENKLFVRVLDKYGHLVLGIWVQALPLHCFLFKKRLVSICLTSLSRCINGCWQYTCTCIAATRTLGQTTCSIPSVLPETEIGVEKLCVGRIVLFHLTINFYTPKKQTFTYSV